MRKLILVLAVVVALVTASAAFALAGPRLGGTFNVVGTIHANDFGIPDGPTTPDVWKFTSKCRRGQCRTVKVDRDGGNHAHYKSTLTRVRKNVYKGTEGPYPYSCPDNAHSTFTAKHTIKITKSKNGKATEFSGKSNVKIANCGFASFVNYTLKGKMR